MVNIIIKGVSPEGRLLDKPTYEITTIKAGVTLRDKGGLFLTISDMKLSKDLKEFFDKRK